MGQLFRQQMPNSAQTSASVPLWRVSVWTQDVWDKRDLSWQTKQSVAQKNQIARLNQPPLNIKHQIYDARACA